MRTIRQLIDLGGRRAIVTGGVGLLGQPIVESLLELGTIVGVLDEDAEKCEKMTARWGSGAVSLPCDLARERDTRETVQRFIERQGGLDILIHCAGYTGARAIPGWTEPFDRQTVEAWDQALRVNLTSAFVLAQEARPALERDDGGVIILISSIFGEVAPDWKIYRETTMSNPMGYGASKGGLLSLTRYLSTALAPRIRVNAISPGGVLADQPLAFQDRYRERTPLGRMATEEDIKGAVAYLASDLSAYVTGQNLIVDGGWTAW